MSCYRVSLDKKTYVLVNCVVISDNTCGLTSMVSCGIVVGAIHVEGLIEHTFLFIYVLFVDQSMYFTCM